MKKYFLNNKQVRYPTMIQIGTCTIFNPTEKDLKSAGYVIKDIKRNNFN